MDSNVADVPYASVKSTVLERVRSRKRWRSEVRGCVALCDEAARRASLRRDPEAETFESPLSEAYVQDRIELDEPLLGWMARERGGGRLQGFLLATNFTTWIAADHIRFHAPHAPSPSSAAEALARRLNACARDGDPLTTGCVWSRVLELSVVGALGCGGALVRSLLQWLQAEQPQQPRAGGGWGGGEGEGQGQGRQRGLTCADGAPYELLVLQATKNAVPFYERLGFVHVGAEARHFTRIEGGGHGAAGHGDGDECAEGGSGGDGDATARVVRDSVGPWAGFRHFEYVAGAAEPSYMMVRAVRQGTHSRGGGQDCAACATPHTCALGGSAGAAPQSAASSGPRAGWLWPWRAGLGGGAGGIGIGSGASGTDETDVEEHENNAAGGRAGARARGSLRAATLLRFWGGSGADGEGGEGGAAPPAKKRRVHRHRKRASCQSTTLLNFFNRKPVN
eukprot:g7940.t1